MKGKFSNTLALVDAIPVVIFGVTLGIIASEIHSTVFLVGGLLSAFAGLCKVAWKFVLANFEKDIKLLTKQFRFTMPIGFLLMVIGVITKRNSINFSGVFESAISFPAVVFLALTIVTMVAMIIMAKKLDQNSAKSNWIEQGANILMQIFVLLTIIFIMK